MGLRMGERRALRWRGGTAAPARRRRRSRSEFVQTTGSRTRSICCSWGRTRLVQIDGQMVKLVVGRPRRETTAPLRPGGAEGSQADHVFDFMCGKRLVAH